jgi:alpha-tubulin suppressor-like RCC1 family protein
MTRFLAIAAGPWHSLGIRSDGSLVAWGWDDYGQCNVPAGRDYTEIGGGYYHSLALKVDRSIVAWGGNGDAVQRPTAGFRPY